MARYPFSQARANGFTLVEIVIVLALVAVVGSVSLFFGLDSFRAYAFHSDRDLLVATLEHARAEAIGNQCQANSESVCVDGRPHGVRIDADRIHLFQTVAAMPDYTHRDASVDAVFVSNEHTTFGGDSEVVFSQLSGDVATPAAITVTEAGGRISTITIGAEGQISWTN